MKSIIVSKIFLLYQWIVQHYRESYTHNLVKKFQASLGRLFMGSGFVKSLIKDDQEDLRESWSHGHLLRPLTSLFKLGPLIRSSKILELLTSTRGLGLLWAGHILSYGVLPTSLSMVISIGLTGLLLCRLAFHPVAWPSRGVTISSILIMASLVVGAIFNPLNYDTLSIMIIYGTTILLTITFIMTIEDKKIFYLSLYGLGVTVLLYSLYGVYQKIVGVPVDPAWLDEDATRVVRIYSVFGNPNVFGEFLVLTLPLMFAGFNVSKKWTSKIFFLGVFFLGCLNIMLSFSRGSMICFAGGMFLLIVIRDRRYMPLFIVGLLLSPILLPESIWARILTLFQGGDSSSDYRTSIYLASADMLRDHFFVGVGLGNFKEIYKAYAYSASKTFHAHNTYLMLWLELGLFGLVSWLGFVFVWIKQMFTMKGKSPYSYYVVAAFAGIAGCAVQALSEHIFHNYDILFYFFLVIAIGYLGMKLHKEYDYE